jgi:probable rRNA maturation factor
MITVDIKSNAGYRFDHGYLKERIRAWLADQGLDDAEVSLAFIGQRKMRHLNLDFRQLDKISDVLTFPQKEGRTPEGILILGDIVVCYPCAQKEAIIYQESIDEAIWDFVEHGLNRLMENL